MAKIILSIIMLAATIGLVYMSHLIKSEDKGYPGTKYREPKD